MRQKKSKGTRGGRSVYFDDKQERYIEGIAKKYNLSFSAVVCDAVEAQMRKNKGESDDVQGQLKNMGTALHEHRERTGQDMFLLTELMLSFVRYYTIHTPGIPEGEEKAAESSGGARFEVFLEDFQKSLLSGGGVAKELFKDEE